MSLSCTKNVRLADARRNWLQSARNAASRVGKTCQGINRREYGLRKPDSHRICLLPVALVALEYGQTGDKVGAFPAWLAARERCATAWGLCLLSSPAAPCLRLSPRAPSSACSVR